MVEFKEKSVIFFVALDMLATGKADCAKDAFAIWPQETVPATLNAVKIAYARIRGRQYAEYRITKAGAARAAEVQDELNEILGRREHKKRHPVNSVFALGNPEWSPSR